MSDFIYSTTCRITGELACHIESIYHSVKPSVTEYHGAWGALAVSHNLYNGFQPLETDNHVVVVVGGPILCFQDNNFLTGDDTQEGTRAIFQRWINGDIKWDEDLNGPFVVLIVDKRNSDVFCITDLLMFIPVYKFEQDSVLILGTHIDSLADVSGQISEIDPVSVVDFILHDVVTYPYTVYSRICQCHPGAVHIFSTVLQDGCTHCKREIYWLPEEKNSFKNISEAGSALRRGLDDYVTSVTSCMTYVAQFISAGEDSRALAGLLPKHLKRDAFVFVDKQNRESRIAKEVAHVYRLNFYPKYRSKTHYLDILAEAADLIGTGHQYTHAHTLRFHDCCRLNKYDAVFGGLSSDALLKASYSNKTSKRYRLPFIPQLFLTGETRSQKIFNPLFKAGIMDEINRRRLKQLRKVQQFRPKTAHEWFVLWPATMRASSPNLYCNRRLFRSYEPFMANPVVKISAAAPTSWKLNRRLFHKAVRSYLVPSKWILHPEDHFPYFPWWANGIVQFVIRVGRGMKKRVGLIESRGNQGPWGDWSYIFNSKNWQDAINQNKEGFKVIKNCFVENDVNIVFACKQLNDVQKVNLLQVLYSLGKKLENKTDR